MTRRSFLRVIPADPGWRIARVWEDEGHKFALGLEPVIAWVELEDAPGELRPVLRDSDGGRAVSPLDDDDRFLAILAPGESVSPESRRWKAPIASILEKQR